MSAPSSFADLERLADLAEAYATLSGVPQQLSGELTDLYEALEAGQAVLVELPWFEQRNGETIQRNQILVQDCDGERIYFANPRRGEHVAGETIAANGLGPERRIEAEGLESMELGLFKRLFEQGNGLAMIEDLGDEKLAPSAALAEASTQDAPEA